MKIKFEAESFGDFGIAPIPIPLMLGRLFVRTSFSHSLKFFLTSKGLYTSFHQFSGTEEEFKISYESFEVARFTLGLGEGTIRMVFREDGLHLVINGPTDIFVHLNKTYNDLKWQVKTNEGRGLDDGEGNNEA